jgi:hypothetical protein
MALSFRVLRAHVALRFAALGLPLISGCGDNQDDAGARKLLGDVQDDGYRSWERAPGWPEREKSHGPHGEEVDIYVNDVIASALAAGEPLEAWPTGSRIAKDGWNGAELGHVALMEKRDDGWFWAEFDGDGNPTYSGHPEECTGCHGRGSDYVLSFKLP